MFRSLPSGINFEDIRKEARLLFHRLRGRDAAALERYYSFDPFAGMFEPRIYEAQYIIAREYGFGSWQKLKAHVNTFSTTGS
jgi:hypothetical protein